jgi:hypothetical protein
MTAKKSAQDIQTEPNPELQAKLTVDSTDRAEAHIPEEPADAAEQRSAEAPGVRTEPEIVADHQADDDRAAAALIEGGHTADPATSTSAVQFPRVENRDKLYFFKRISDGWVDAVNEGTPEHARVLSDPDFEPATRADAKKAADA